MNAPERPIWFPAVSVLAEARSRDRRCAVLQGHTRSVDGAAFSPDGTPAVTASVDKAASLCDAKTGASLAVLQGHTGSVTSAVFSPDGARLVTASADKSARLWDAKTGASLMVLQGHAGIVQSAAFSPDGTRVARRSIRPPGCGMPRPARRSLCCGDTRTSS